MADIFVQMGKRDKIILAIFIPCMLIAAYMYFLIIPSIDELKRHEALLNEKSKTVQDYPRLQKKEQDAETQIKRLDDEINKFKLKLKYDMQDGMFLIDFFNEIKNNNLLLEEFTPKGALGYDDYMVLPVSLSIKGSYPGIKKFLKFLENYDNHISIMEVKMSSEQNSPRVTSPGSIVPFQQNESSIYNLSMQMNIFSLPAPEKKISIQTTGN